MSLSLPFRNRCSSSSPRSVTATSLSLTLHDEPVSVQPGYYGTNIVGGGYDSDNQNQIWDDHRLIFKARALQQQQQQHHPHHPISTDNSFDSSYHSPENDEEEDEGMQLQHNVLSSSFTLGGSLPPTPTSPPSAAAEDADIAGMASHIEQLLDGNTTAIHSRNRCSSSISTISRRKRKLLFPPLQPTMTPPSTTNTTTTKTLSLEEEDRCNFRMTTSRRRMNFRHRSVCHETVRWLAASETMAISKANALAANVVAEEEDGEDGDTDLSSSKHTSKRPRFPSSSSSHSSSFFPRPVVEELWLGPVFEDSSTILSAIKTLPSSVRYLDLDLRNALNLLPQAMPILLRKTHITTLSIRFFGDAGAVELAKWIHLNPNLERLNLQGNRIGSFGARTLVDAIIASGHHRRNLKHLNLSCNCILHGDLIGQLLALSSSLQSVDLQYNWLGDQDIQHICQGLRKNTSLRELNFYGCQRVTKSGMETLLKCLELHNTSLHSIKVQALDKESEKLVSRIAYWTDLNKAGRYLVHSSSVVSGIWPLALERSSKDQEQPNALYHLLRHGSPKILHDRRKKVEDRRR